jgi:hypothetical protein
MQNMKISNVEYVNFFSLLSIYIFPPFIIFFFTIELTLNRHFRHKINKVLEINKL